MIDDVRWRDVVLLHLAEWWPLYLALTVALACCGAGAARHVVVR